MNETTEQFKRYKIPNTPFQIHQDLDGKHLLLGSYKIAPQTFQTDEEINEYLKTNLYDVILTLILVANDYTNATKKNDTE